MKRSINKPSIRLSFYFLLVHPVPAHPNAQAHTFGLVHVPPFAHVGEHDAKRTWFMLIHHISIVGDGNLRVVHVAPLHGATHVQVLGAVQVPPLEHPEEQTAKIIIQILDNILISSIKGEKRLT